MWCDHKLCVLNSYPQIVHCVKTIGHLYVRGKEYMKGVELPLTSSTVGTYTGSCWLPNTVMYDHLLPYMVLAGDTDSEGKVRSFSLRVASPQTSFVGGEMNAWQTNPKGRLRGGYAESVFKIFIRLEYFLYRVQYYEWNLKRKEKRSTPWVNFDDTSKFCGEKYIGSSRLNIYRFSFASHLRMAHELSLKVYKVKACLLRLQCRVSSKI